MFDVWCARHGTRVLLFPPDIESLVNTPDGVEVHWRCPCGQRGMWLTGRPAARAQPPVAVVAANRSSSP